MEAWLIYSHEHEAWWRPQSSGYTTLIDLAGWYSRADALAIVEGAMDGWHPQPDGSDLLPHEVMVLANSRNMISAVTTVTVAMIVERGIREAQAHQAPHALDEASAR